LALNKLDPDQALRTRGYVINVDPTNEEIYHFLEKICMKIPLDVDYTLNEADRKEIIDLLRTRKIPEKTANIRSFVRALNTRAGVEKMGGSTEEWKRFTLRFC
jgi:myosin-crossreactive antigen